MIAESEQAQVWECEEWEPAPALPKGRTRKGIEICPYVGLRLPAYPTEYSLKAAWFSKQELRSWYIKPMRRRALYNLMRRNLHNWAEWLRLDSTYTFDRELRDYRKFNDGATIGITGPKGSGKSWLAQMVLNRAVDTTPHVIFEYKDLEINIPQRGKEAVGILVDENLKATGSDSKNLVIHVNNALDTGRKAELWVNCTGINLSFQGWGDTLDIRMIPFGFNRRFQATRAAFFDVKNDLLGFCVLQREHTPKDSVYYYSELGTWDEYEARARAYSLGVTRKGGATDAIDDTTQDRHVAAMKDYLKARYVDKHLGLPTDLMCRRLYRKAKLPPKSIGYMNEVIAWAKFELEDNSPEEPHPLKGRFGVFSKDWAGLQQFIGQWCLKHEPAREEYAAATALWIVPDAPPLSQDDVFDMIDFGAKPVKAGTLAREIRKLRKRIQRPDLEFTDFTESWVASQLDLLGAQKAGGKNAVDIILHDDREVAVKFCVRNDPFYDYTVAPETDGVVIIIIPRLLKFFVIPIKDNVVNEHLQLDNTRVREGGVLVGIEDLVGTVKEMIER